MFLRLLYLGFNSNILFIFINRELRNDWKDILNTKKEIQIREKSLYDYVRKFFGYKVDVQFLSWNTFKKLYMTTANSHNIFLKKFVEQRRPFYKEIFNALNLIYLFSPNRIKKLFFFDSKSFELPKYFRINDYLVIGIRYNNSYRIESNISKDEFLNIYSNLKKNFPNLKYMIVSDTDGCNYIKKLANASNINDIYLSKDYSKSFLEDAAIVLNSEYYFQYKGTGLSVIPTFSKIKYCIVAKRINELPIGGRKKIATWSNNAQKFFEDETFMFSQLIR